MSKDKLQEIKRQYELREAGVVLDNNDVKELMKLSYNQALEDAVNNAEVDEIYDNPINPSMGHTYGVDQQSILKLKIK